MKSLAGKKALVTGAASGIGLQIALELSRQGADLLLIDRDEPGLQSAVQATRANGVEAFSFCADLAVPEQVSLCTQRALRLWGTLDILVNNAGVCYQGPTDRMTAEQWEWLLQINLKTPIQLTRELLSTLLERGEAHVLNVCSIAGLVAGRNLTAYHTSKFALVGFSEALRAEYDHRGLGVTALCPGLVKTRFFSSAVSGRASKPVREPSSWMSISAECVAKKAVRAIKRNQGLVLISPMAHLLWFTKRLSPWLMDFISRFRRHRSKPKQHTPETVTAR